LKQLLTKKLNRYLSCFECVFLPPTALSVSFEIAALDLLTNRKAPTVKEEKGMCKPAGALILKQYFNKNNFPYVLPIKEQTFELEELQIEK